MRFRFIVLTLLLALAFSSSAEAQLRFGLRAGLNVSQLSGADFEGKEAKMGLVGGFFAEYEVSDLLSLQPEIIYSQQGINFYTESDFEGGVLDVTYIHVPVLLKAKAAVLDNVIASPFLGPQVGLKLSETVALPGVPGSTNWFNPIDVGIAVGLDLSADLADRQSRFGIGVRYTVGLINALDEDVADATARNNVLSLTTFFRF